MFQLLLIALMMPLCGSMSQSFLINNDRDTRWMKDQDDQTDTLAIPLDSSEVEEEQEMDALQKEARAAEKKSSKTKQ